MYKIKLTKTEIIKLKKLKQSEKNKRIFRRLQCLELSHKGKECKEIADITGVCVDTITDWIKLYLNKGIIGLCHLDFKNKRQSKIDDYADKINKDVKNNMISTLSELQDWLKNHYDIEIEQSWLFRCCKKNSIYLTKKHV
ncbi:helix-turn-helix domain-containing protein [Patescibacteria group bacterium]|nr:helix-turn-helix domain-containing protein [Patescibacteria group bacterium]MBU4338841.1 helix-turn-helix domain-containing protein [Patescibacteria group bacterium]